MNGSRDKALDSSFSPIILDPALTSAKATVDAANITKSATIRAAEIASTATMKTADAAVISAELALKGSKYRSWATVAVALIGLGSFVWANYDVKKKLQKTESLLEEALATNQELRARLDKERRENALLTRQVNEFMKSSESINPLTLYPALRQARSRVEYETVLPKSQQLS
jgi:hypothetical protein